MVVKMLAHYHGRLSADQHWEKNQLVAVTAEAGAELIQRGLAVEETEQQKPAPPKRGKAGQTS